MYSVEFKKNLNIEVDYLTMFLTNTDVYGSRAIVLKYHPKLKFLLKGVKDLDKKSIIKSYLIDYYKKEGSSSDKYSESIANAWKIHETLIIKTFMEILNYKPKNPTIITAYRGSILVNPYNYEDKNFMYCYYAYDYSSQLTIAHEVFHMIYFDLWKELFPRDFPEIINSTGPLWKLSEIIVCLVLSDERLTRIIPAGANASFFMDGKDYADFPTPDNKNTVLGYFRSLYLKDKYSTGNFHNLLRNFREIVLHESLF